MDKNPAPDHNNFSRPQLQPVLLTPAEATQVAGGAPYFPIPPGYASHIRSYTPFIPVPPL
jgi:hypothetical protein